MRRVMMWMWALIGICTVILVGGRSIAQEDRPIVWMVVYKYDIFENSYALFLQDPMTGDRLPIDRAQLRIFLQDGSIPYDAQRDLYKWTGGYGSSMPEASQFVDILAGEYLENLVWDSEAHPSPDWNWVVYKQYGERRNGQGDHLYAVHLDEGVPRDLFAQYNLRHRYDYFAVVFSPDGEWVYVNAEDVDGNQGIYRLHLDGNNPSQIEPIMEGEHLPLVWLEGTEQILVTSFAYADPDSWFAGWLDLWLLNANDGLARPIVQPKERVQVFFEGWLSDKNTFLISTSEDSNLPNALEVFELSPTIKPVWGLLHWRILDLTFDREWIILENNQKIARMRTDGSLFEVVAEVPAIWKNYGFSTDGTWMAVVSSDRQTNEDTLYRVNLETGVVTELAKSPIYKMYLGALSPHGEWLTYTIETGQPSQSERYIVGRDNKPIPHDAIEGYWFLTWVILDATP